MYEGCYEIFLLNIYANVTYVPILMLVTGFKTIL